MSLMYKFVTFHMQVRAILNQYRRSIRLAVEAVNITVTEELCRIRYCKKKLIEQMTLSVNISENDLKL